MPISVPVGTPTEPGSPARAAAGWRPSGGSPRSCRTPPASAPGRRAQPAQQRGRQRRAARADEPQRVGRRPRSSAWSRIIWCSVGPADSQVAPCSRACGQNRCGVKRRGTTTAPAGCERREGRRHQAVDVEQRHHAERDVGLARAGSARRSCGPRPSGCAGAAAPASAGWWYRWCAGRRRRRQAPPCSKERGKPRSSAVSGEQLRRPVRGGLDREQRRPCYRRRRRWLPLPRLAGISISLGAISPRKKPNSRSV